jgi:hypothetical protein
MTRITVSLVTLGDPGRYQDHHRTTELAPACAATVRFVWFPPARVPKTRPSCDLDRFVDQPAEAIQPYDPCRPWLRPPPVSMPLVVSIRSFALGRVAPGELLWPTW